MKLGGCKEVFVEVMVRGSWVYAELLCLLEP
jgi:hypothetical protein